jgi:hypothetical protein
MAIPPYRHDSLGLYKNIIKQFLNNIPSVNYSGLKALSSLLGVHIRQGDYKDFGGGKYFYDTDEYIKIMKRIEYLFPGKKVMFLVCSNAKQIEGKFASFRFIFGNNHLVEDMYSLAKCDYIIGPTSTYSVIKPLD